jgi:ABC-type transport system involved in multi-copper enzyme maturation permease subunit
MEPLTGHGLLIARQSFDHFIRLGWEVFKFLLIIGIAPSFVELLKDPLLSIVLTKKISRAQLMLMRWSGIILSVGIIQALYATSMVLVLLFKTSVLSVSFIIPVILGPLAYVITFAALACLLGILFEHATGVTVVVLAVNYIGAFVESVTQQTESWVRLIGYLFPPLATTEKFFLDTMLYGSPDGILPERLLVYPIAYLTLAILLFRQKDL